MLEQFVWNIYQISTVWTTVLLWFPETFWVLFYYRTHHFVDATFTYRLKLQRNFLFFFSLLSLRRLLLNRFPFKTWQFLIVCLLCLSFCPAIAITFQSNFVISVYFSWFYFILFFILYVVVVVAVQRLSFIQWFCQCSDCLKLFKLSSIANFWIGKKSLQHNSKNVVYLKTVYL